MAKHASLIKNFMSCNFSSLPTLILEEWRKDVMLLFCFLMLMKFMFIKKIKKNIWTELLYSHLTTIYMWQLVKLFIYINSTNLLKLHLMISTTSLISLYYTHITSFDCIFFTSFSYFRIHYLQLHNVQQDKVG